MSPAARAAPRPASRRPRPPRAQGGVVLVLFAVGVIAVIGMAGLALDLGRAYLNKARLQNALDAAALDAARVLFDTGSSALATAAAQASYGANMDSGTPAVAFSSSWPFGAAGANPRFVRVSVDGLALPAMLSATFLGSSVFAISGSAVAGPQPLGGEVCGVPLGLCGVSGSSDTTCDENGCYGIGAGEQELKDDPTGPGNYGLMDMGSGASATADGFAGQTEFCAAPGAAKATQPGKASATTFSALNTRFGAGTGSFVDATKFPADVVTTSPQTYAAYSAALAGGAYTNPGGVARRRTVLVPVVDCSDAKGKSTVTVLGNACVFLTRQVPTSGASIGSVYAEMISDPCASPGGTPTTNPASAAARIVLFSAGAQS